MIHALIFPLFLIFFSAEFFPRYKSAQNLSVPLLPLFFATPLRAPVGVVSIVSLARREVGQGFAVAGVEEIGAKMNHCAMQQQNAFIACEEIRAPFAVAERKPPVLCPKPRRVSPFASVVDPVRPLRWHTSHQLDLSDSKAGADLLDIFLSKGAEQNQVSCSPPFFCGSPPSRAANPVVRDARFGEDRPPAPFAPSPLTQSGPPVSPKQGCAHAKFGLVPAAVRVEGFDCLNRGRRSCSSITAMA